MQEMKMKFESNLELTNEILNNNFHKARLTVMHSGLNKNGSIISEEVMRKASDSIKNTPLLAHILKDEEGNITGEFGGHDVEYNITNDENGDLYLKETYLEQPIGVIPESANIMFEQIDDKLYLTCDAYIWKTYSNDAYDILLNKGIENVSCEITCKDTRFSDNEEKSLEILDFEFLGVTVIGIEPGMEGANINMQFSNEQYCNKVEELNKMLKYNLESKEDVEMENNIDDTKTFTLSIDNLTDSIYKQIENEMTTIYDPYWNEAYSTNRYNLITIIPDENTVVLYDNSDKNYYGVKYNVEGDCVALDFETKKEYISIWREKLQKDNSIVFANQDDCLAKVVKEKFSSKEDEIETLKEEITLANEKLTELNELRVFKEEVLRKEKELELTNAINEVISEFSLEEEEIADIKAKVIAGEMDMETFTLHLKAIQYDKGVVNKNFSKEEGSQKMMVREIDEEKTDSTVEQINRFKDEFLNK